MNHIIQAMKHIFLDQLRFYTYMQIVRFKLLLPMCLKISITSVIYNFTPICELHAKKI